MNVLEALIMGVVQGLTRVFAGFFQRASSHFREDNGNERV